MSRFTVHQATWLRTLREMAEQADAGRLIECILCYTLDGEFEFRLGASKLNCIAMASMLHAEAIDHIREAA